MKYIIGLLVLISLVTCEPNVIGQVIPAEEAFTEIKKKYLNAFRQMELLLKNLDNMLLFS